ncbi:MAG: putative photosynthetic complex assembly protein PuhE [Pseudomonadota bacterium]
MTNAWIVMLFTVFVWWLSTGAILVLVKTADHDGGNAHRKVVLWSVPVLLASMVLLWWSLQSFTVLSAYGAFMGALGLWGWFELAFLAGVITGPNVCPCPPGIPSWERFVRAWGTIAYSELALAISLAVLVVVSWNAPNQVGMLTFVVLFFARISAKLNVYLGVPNINVEFLPLPVRHLASHFRIAPINWFFPFSITALSFASACFLERAYWQSAGSAELVGFVLLATLTGLALLEHWLMVLPIPDAKLWRWMIPQTKGRVPSTKKSLSRETAHGL